MSLKVVTVPFNKTMIFEHYIEDLSIKVLCLQGLLKTREHDKEYITDGFLFPKSVQLLQ